MKIQTYRPRAQLTDEVVAQPLNVKANSSAFESVGQSVAGFQQTLNNAAKWMVAEQKLANAKEVGKGTNAFNIKLEQIRETIEADPKFNSDPKKMEVEFTKRANTARNLVLRGVSGSAAKSTFSSDAQKTATAKVLKAKQNARVRLTAEAITTKLLRSDQLQREIGQLDPGRDKYEYQRKMEELFGNPLTKKPGIFGELVLVGHLNKKEQYTYEKNARNKISVHQVEKGLLQANQLSLTSSDMKTGAAAKSARAVLMKLQKGDYPDLTVQARQDLSERANNLIFSLERSRIAESERKLRNEGKERIIKQDNNFIAYLTTIGESQRDPSDLTKRTAMPTLADLEIARAQKKISPEQYNKIINVMNNQFAQVTDKVYHSELLRRIRNADDKQQIDDIVKEAYGNLNPQSRTPLDFQQVKEVVQFAEQFVTKTPRAIETKKYGNFLEALTKPTNILDKLLGGASARAESVLFQFDGRVKEGGMSPQEAFQEAIQQFQITEQANLNALTYPLYPPKSVFVMDEVRKVPTATKKDLKDWTVDDVEQARDTTLKKFKGKPLLLGSELYKLRMLQKYIEAKSPAMDAAKRQQARELQDKN